MPKNDLMIQAKIHDVKSQILLLQAARGGDANANEEIAGAAGVGSELAEQIEFQEFRIKALEGCLESDEATITHHLEESLKLWLQSPNTKTRVLIDICRFALGHQNLEAWMIAKEATNAR
jgi:hypothetical protein